ncbi:hypothetical protein MRS44_003893 [Fusarium solani]|uniref:uncharacterized protein n=1 Tax=Fusarium solani TaxID=169388 RepID=UPI0032C4A59B|nr:hypothetical protein MRS44_003838 [Fusarium solani]KAJ3469828.1 hypothetical protein MRS44_003893 [Fusarium solani]
MKEKNLTPTNEQLGGSLSEPEGNAGFKGVEYGSSKAPAGGEISTKATKKAKTKSPFRRREHIFRRHMLSDSQCCNCFEDFGTKPALDEHRQDPCRQKPSPRPYGINREQEKQLRSRKMYQTCPDEEEKWRAIYTIIFPGGENLPSPYYEPEVPEFPDYYRHILIEKLPGSIIEELTAIANPAQISADPQLVRQVENAVKVAVRKTLLQVDGSTKSNDDFQTSHLNAEVQFAGMEQVQMRQTSPLELDWPLLFGNNHSDDALQHTSGAGLELWDSASNAWGNLDNNDTFSIGWQDASADLDLSPNVSGLASGRNQPPLPILETQPQVFSQDHVQSANLGYESIIGLLDSDDFDNWALLDQTAERVL